MQAVEAMSWRQAEPDLRRVVESIRVPDWFIVGAEKAGTTSLYHYLGQHQDVAAPGPKEPHFLTHAFDRCLLTGGWHHAVQRYGRRNDVPEHQVLGEASTSYLWHAKAAARLQAINPAARVVVLLREPVARAWSHYLMHRRGGAVEESFLGRLHRYERDGVLHGVEYVTHGLYARALREYLDRFDAVYVTTQDRLRDHTEEVVREVLLHVGANPEAAHLIDTTKRHNAWREGRIPVQPGVRRLARRVLPKGVRDAVGAWLLEPSPAPEVPEAVRDVLAPYFEVDHQRLKEMEAHVRGGLSW